MQIAPASNTKNPKIITAIFIALGKNCTKRKNKTANPRATKKLSIIVSKELYRSYLLPKFEFFKVFYFKA